VRRGVAERLEQLPPHAARAVGDLLEHLRGRQGIGPITASALIASVGDLREFKNGRQFSAWLGLVPRQHSTGGKQRLGHITGRGDPYRSRSVGDAHRAAATQNLTLIAQRIST